LAFLGLLLLAFVLRFAFLSTSSTDDQVHLWNVKLRARHGDIGSHAPFDSVVEGKRGYPTLQHYIVSRFPERHWRLAGKLLNLSYDLVLVIFTWCLASLVVPQGEGAQLSPALLAVAAMATSPLLMPINSRVKSMGGRILGNVFAQGYLLSAWYAVSGNAVLGVLGMVFFGLLVVLSSKFALQFILFSSPLISLLCLSPYPLSGAALVVLLAWSLPWLGLSDVSSFMFRHSCWYKRNFQTVSSVSYRNRFRDLLALPRLFLEDQGVFWGTLFRRSSYLIALYSFPIVWVVLCFSVQMPVFGGPLDALGYGFAVIFSAIILFLLTSLRPLLFLGQAERYLEFCLPYAAVLLALAYSRGYMSLTAALGLILFQLIMTIANLAYSHYATIKKALQPPNSGANWDFLPMLKGKRILTIPIKQAFMFSHADDGDNLYYYRFINTPESGFSYLETDQAHFELPRPDFEFFVERYGIDTVIASKDEGIARAARHGINYPFNEYETLFEDDKYLVVSLRANRTVESSR